MMKRLDTPLAPTVFPNGGGDDKKGKGKNKSCTPTNMKHCSAYGDNATGPKGPKGGKPTRRGKGSNFRSPGGKKALKQFCNTYPNHPSCNKNSKVIIDPKTGKRVS